MKLYLIGGLGADHRVFEYLKLEVPTYIIKWNKPHKKEPIVKYAERLIVQIDTSEKFAIAGVSFGGILAIEISKIVIPQSLILISSVIESSQLPRIYVSIGKLGVLKLVPNLFIKPPTFLSTYFFGAQNKKLLQQIINDTSPVFIRWALNKILEWKSSSLLIPTLRIHGTNDKIIPLKGNALQIKNGGHFMVVDRAKEISMLINNHFRSVK